MKKSTGIMILSFIVFFCFYSGAFLYGGQTYHFKAPNYRIEMIRDGYHKILMDGYFSYAVPGYPDVPSKIFQIAVPPDVDLKSIDVEYHERKKISLGSFNIPELPAMETWVNGQRIIGKKADIYSNDSYYPEDTIEHLGCSQLRKWRIVNIKYSPFQYNPVTKALLFVPEVTLVIKYSGPSVRILSDTELADTIMDRRAKKILINYSEAREWYLPKGVAPGPLQTYNYVIITTNATCTASTKLTDFINYLTAKGYSVNVITETDFGGLTGQYPNTKAEKIREWLKSNYVSMGIEYVLLIGNPSSYEYGEGDVPMKLCWPYYDGTGPESGWWVSPTDYFYADLTGDWDLNGDGYYGDYDHDLGVGGVDFANELCVGRIPVYSGVTDLDSVLGKIISYGNPPDISWRRSALLPMSFSDSGTDGAYLGEAMMSNYLSPLDYSCRTLYMQGSLCQEADSTFFSDEELLNGVTKTNWMNNPYGMVWWWGHGNETGAYLGYEECGWGTIMSSSDASSLNDDYPSFVYQCSCKNGFPEVSNNLGTALLYNGAIATVSASRVSWYAQGSWHTTLKYYCDNASIGYYYGRELVSNEKKAAVALYNVKSDMGINGGRWGGASWMNLFDFNLYGSPETYIIVKYDLTVSTVQGGTTSPSPATYTYPAGTEVAITATADTNYRFSGWTGDLPSGHENDNPITISMDSDKSLEANFIRQYNLNIVAGTGGTTDPTAGTHTYDSGTEVAITATADTNYRFSGWTGDVPSGHENDNPITITMDSDKSITANFSAKTGEAGKKDGCFIASAAYSSPLHPHVNILRDFRDRYLMPSKLGRMLVNFYYKYSPSIADLIAKYKILRVAVRINLLPLIAFSYLMIYSGPIITVVMLVFIFGLPIFFITFFRKRIRRVEAKSHRASAPHD
jgi:hypothetical protein